jgi:hypothetical protein
MDPSVCGCQADALRASIAKDVVDAAALDLLNKVPVARA